MYLHTWLTLYNLDLVTTGITISTHNCWISLNKKREYLDWIHLVEALSHDVFLALRYYNNRIHKGLTFVDYCVTIRFSKWTLFYGINYLI